MEITKLIGLVTKHITEDKLAQSCCVTSLNKKYEALTMQGQAKEQSTYASSDRLTSLRYITTAFKAHWQKKLNCLAL